MQAVVLSSTLSPHCVTALSTRHHLLRLTKIFLGRGLSDGEPSEGHVGGVAIDSITMIVLIELNHTHWDLKMLWRQPLPTFLKSCQERQHTSLTQLLPGLESKGNK